VSRPQALDLFCGAGGASMGLHRAGFDVTGADIKPQPRFPFRFVQADALAPPFDLSRFDLIWASPPCQRFSTLTKPLRRHLHPDIIESVRSVVAVARYWVIENVRGAPLASSVVLCGSGFDLRVRRHRHFEASFPLIFAPQCRHDRQGHPLDVTGSGARRKTRMPGDRGGRLYAPLNLADARDAMGINWMSRLELSQAVPPAYAEYIGTCAMRIMELSDAAE
jgi:DNA (cytosine-5)-methyltransferase 1